MTIRELGKLDPARALEELTLKYSKLKEHNQQLQQALSYNNRIMEGLERRANLQEHTSPKPQQESIIDPEEEVRKLRI